jgi:hypothetical protein
MCGFWMEATEGEKKCGDSFLDEREK